MATPFCAVRADNMNQHLHVQDLSDVIADFASAAPKTDKSFLAHRHILFKLIQRISPASQLAQPPFTTALLSTKGNLIPDYLSHTHDCYCCVFKRIRYCEY